MSIFLGGGDVLRGNLGSPVEWRTHLEVLGLFGLALGWAGFCLGSLPLRLLTLFGGRVSGYPCSNLSAKLGLLPFAEMRIC